MLPLKPQIGSSKRLTLYLPDFHGMLFNRILSYSRGRVESEIDGMAEPRKTQMIMATLIVAMAIALTTSSVQALAVSKPKMGDLNPKGEPWIPALVRENTEFQMTIWGEDNATVSIVVKIENENALAFATFDPENFTLAPGESKQVRCVLSPTRTGVFKSSIVISESSQDNVLGNPITKSIAFDVEVHAELPPATIDLTKVIVLATIILIIVAISLTLLKSRFKRINHRVLNQSNRLANVTSLAPSLEFSHTRGWI
jgi:hypothetical protein